MQCVSEKNAGDEGKLIQGKACTVRFSSDPNNRGKCLFDPLTSETDTFLNTYCITQITSILRSKNVFCRRSLRDKHSYSVILLCLILLEILKLLNEIKMKN
jgi:hypothetical protein